MDRQKQLALLRKRNADLTGQLDGLRFRLDYDTQLNKEGYRRAKELIAELEQIKTDWLRALSDLEKQKEQYAVLIERLREVKKHAVS